MRQITCIQITGREQLAKLQCNPALGPKSNLVYIYFFFNRVIAYPKRASNIVYIGEAMRVNEPTGVRFRQHITPSAITGADTGNNLVLSQYFFAGWPIGLYVFDAGKEKRKELERNLIYAHIRDFGAPPIAQNKIPQNEVGKNRTAHIMEFINRNANQINKASNLLKKILKTHE